MLLISATLGQSGQVSPPRGFSLAAFETAGSTGAVSSQSIPPSSTVPDTTSSDASTPGSDAPVNSSDTSPDPVPAPAQEQTQDQTPHTIPAPDPIPRAGSGYVVPQDDRFRFNKAVPVRMAPVRIQIPAAWVDARVRTVGITPDGEMEAPEDFWEVGWYRYGTRPGDEGKSVMAGHLDSHDGAAVFYHIGDLQPGDDIRVLLGGPDGERFYKVREVAQFHVDDAPLDRIFGPSDSAELILITCGGDWLGNDAGGYTDRIVVFADLIIPGEPEAPAQPDNVAPSG